VIHGSNFVNGKTIYLFERGIDGWTAIFGGWRDWPNQAIVWIHRHQRPAAAQTLIYFTTALIARFTRKARAQSFLDLIRQYPEHEGWRVVIVAHSEGTATVLDALRLGNWPRIEALHLVSGACDADFNRNGLNEALNRSCIGRVFIYVAEQDWAMKVEDTLAGKWLFGIRTKDQPLGLGGARNVASGFENQILASSDKVVTLRKRYYGHSTWFEPHNMDETMRRFVL
jgi:hypothetical protein